MSLVPWSEAEQLPQATEEDVFPWIGVIIGRGVLASGLWHRHSPAGAIRLDFPSGTLGFAVARRDWGKLVAQVVNERERALGNEPTEWDYTGFEHDFPRHVDFTKNFPEGHGSKSCILFES